VYRKILVGADGSATAAKAVDRAVEVAGATGASLTILTAGRGTDGLAVAQREKERHAASGVPISAVADDGDAVSALLRATEGGEYDLLVTGNKGMTGIRRLSPLGSVPNKVSHHLPCTLLIVRTT